MLRVLACSAVVALGAAKSPATSSPTIPCPMDNSASIFLYRFTPSADSGNEEGVLGGLVSNVQCPPTPFCASDNQVFAQLSADPWPLPAFSPAKPVFGVKPDVSVGKAFSLMAREGWTGVFLSPKTLKLEDSVSHVAGHPPSHSIFGNDHFEFWTGMYQTPSAPVQGSSSASCSSTASTFFDSAAHGARGITGSFSSTSSTWFSSSTASCADKVSVLCICNGAAPCKLQYGVTNIELWYALYDALNGPLWTFCSDARDDPCACAFGKHHVDCAPAGAPGAFFDMRVITHIALPSINASGVFPLSVFESSVQKLQGLDLSSNDAGATNAIALPAGKACIDKDAVCASNASSCIVGALPACEALVPVVATTGRPSRQPVFSTTNSPSASPQAVMDAVLLILVMVAGVVVGLLVAVIVMVVRRRTQTRRPAAAGYSELGAPEPTVTEMSLLGRGRGNGAGGNQAQQTVMPV